ncbi:MAG: DsbA family protein [Halocynthiibacter sp.]
MKSTVIALMASVALTCPAQAFDVSAMSPSEKDAFGAAVRTYLLENPETLTDAIQVLRNREEAQARADQKAFVKVNAKEIFENPNSYVGGNPDGDVTVVEFVDFQCPWCVRAHAEVKNLLAADKNIRFITKDIPLQGEDAALKSRFAVAARLKLGNDAYGAVMDDLFTLRGNVSEESLRRLAQSKNLDPDAFMPHMESAEVTAKIEEDMALFQRLGLNGTPAFIFGDDLNPGYLPVAEMQNRVNALRDAN